MKEKIQEKLSLNYQKKKERRGLGLYISWDYEGKRNLPKGRKASKSREL